MPAAIILNQSQAEAVYSAMCALNNIGARLLCNVPIGVDSCSTVANEPDGTVFVDGRVDDGSADEHHADLDAFATAYGLNSDAAPAEPAAQSKCPGGAACGWDEKAKMGDICRVCNHPIPF